MRLTLQLIVCLFLAWADPSIGKERKGLRRLSLGHYDPPNEDNVEGTSRHCGEMHAMLHVLVFTKSHEKLCPTFFQVMESFLRTVRLYPVVLHPPRAAHPRMLRPPRAPLRPPRQIPQLIMAVTRLVRSNGAMHFPRKVG